MGGGSGALGDHGASARRRLWQTLLVDVGCGGVLDLLPDGWYGYQGSLAEARHPFAMMRSPVGTGESRSDKGDWAGIAPRCEEVMRGERAETRGVAALNRLATG